jgi:hypothetical protein
MVPYQLTVNIGYLIRLENVAALTSSTDDSEFFFLLQQQTSLLESNSWEEI